MIPHKEVKQNLVFSETLIGANSFYRENGRYSDH